MKKLYFLIVAFSLFSALISAQENKFELSSPRNGFNYLYVPIFHPDFMYKPQIYYYIELKVVNKTNEPLVDAKLITQPDTYVSVEYDKEYKLNPIKNFYFYKDQDVKLEFAEPYVSFNKPWQPNDTLTYKIAFAKEINGSNKNELTVSGLNLSHLNFPPKSARLNIDILAKGVYGAVHNQNFEVDLKELWNYSAPKIQEYCENRKKAEAERRKEAEDKKIQQAKEQQKKEDSSNGGGLLGRLLDNLLN
jgi:hypothetical protein